MTALWTAAARACESARSDRLFEDPFAAALAGAASVDAFQRVIDQRGPGIGDLQAVTTRYFDDFLLRLTADGSIRQVVLLASGLDARAFRLPWQARTRLFDVDQPHLVAYKKYRLALMGAAAACAWHPIGVNLQDDWAAQVCLAGFDPAQPSAWLLEECLHFFEPSAAVDLLAVVSAHAAPGSWLAFDITNTGFLMASGTRVWPEEMAAGGAPWLFTCDDPAGMVARLGWSASVVQPGEAEADFGRPTYLGNLESLPASPRAQLVTARRTD
jgi:methyltransferase (TIGR00027 family)